MHDLELSAVEMRNANWMHLRHNIGSQSVFPEEIKAIGSPSNIEMCCNGYGTCTPNGPRMPDHKVVLSNLLI